MKTLHNTNRQGTGPQKIQIISKEIQNIKLQKNIAEQWSHEVDGWIGGSTYASVPLSEVSWPPLWPLLLFPITIIIVIIVIVITIFTVVITTISIL